MKLTKQQIEYAFTRIENIVTDRVDKKATPAPVHPGRLQLADKYAAEA